MTTPSRPSSHGLEARLIPNVKKIAVVRANGVGDFVFSLPALDALRRSYPRAEIVLFGKAWHQKFLTGRPGPIDRVVALPRCRLTDESVTIEESDAAIDSFFKEFERMEGRDTRPFDLAIQMHGGGGNSNPFTQRLGARVSVGFAAEGAPPLDRTIRYQQYSNETLRYLELVRLVGAGTAGAVAASIRPSLTVTPDDVQESEIFVAGDEPFVVIHPSATDARRRWPAEHFAAIADALYQEGYRIALNGTEAERNITCAVMDAMNAPAIDLTGISLGGLYGAISRAQLLLSNDSGPLHLAVPAMTPSVGIVWCGNAITASPVDVDRHAFALSWQTTCPVCNRNARAECDHRSVSWVTDVPVDEVQALVTSLLQQDREESRVRDDAVFTLNS